jgi:hypothetical protein
MSLSVSGTLTIVSGSGGIDDITLPEVDLPDVGDAEDLLPFLDGF